MNPNGASDVAAYDSSIPGFPGSTAGGQEEVGGQVSSCFILYLFFCFVSCVFHQLTLFFFVMTVSIICVLFHLTLFL